MRSLSFILPVTLAAAASAVQLRYDNTYDNAAQSLATVSCSDGANGLLTKGFTTFGSLRNFPNIGAAQAVTGWNSTACGSCWSVTYTNAQGKATSVNILAVDHAGTGFNVAQEAMDTLTGGNAVAFGVVDVTATQVAASACKL
ncbi:hypothetical protein D9757_010974 [Collybiopsis confluens]|uniref:Cerato-platanin n=1 Tax=Collybiopsis confluens TaxID=2823264 RepID=A0A8H5LS97_9AGAR|nr:hypothetical protein D9757_010974 [Collybiopsis confluens]